MDKECPSFQKEMSRIKVMLQAELKIHTHHFLYHPLDRVIESLLKCIKIVGYLCMPSARVSLIFKASKCLLNLTDQSKIVQVDLLIYTYINP